MCGLAGMVLRNGAPAHIGLLEEMGQALNHRGPDHTATLVDGSAGFAHTRLSIIDLSEAGNQPFSDSRYVLCYNGEIYNFLTLREELEQEGVQFRSSSDTEVLFRLLVSRGLPATLSAIRGMFAFSFYDTVSGTLSLARDRFGIKPLNWTQRPDGLYWASETKALAVCLGIEPDPLRALFSVAGGGEQSQWNTTFAGVLQVPPGSYLELVPGREPQIHTYFRAVDLVDEGLYQDLDRSSESEVLEEFSRLFDASVDSMLMSDVPMGVFVSGGLDSNLISAFARRHKPEIQLFTANIVGPYSEFPYAELLADSIDARLTAYRFSPEMLVEDWTDATYYYESPIITFANAIPLARVARLAQTAGVKPVLTGEGSDELFLGYPDARYEMYERILKAPVELMKQLYRLVPGLKRRLYPERRESIEHFVHGLVNDSSGTREEAQRRFTFLTSREARHQATTLQYLEDPLIGLLYRNDRMGMMASIESRFPFLDEDLVRFAINLPRRWKLRTTPRFNDVRHPFVVDKYIVRKTGDMQLPPGLANKNKWYFKVHSFSDISVRDGFFEGGYVEDQLLLSRNGLTQMLDAASAPLIARLASVEIFGRLYGMGECRDEVRSRVTDYITLDVRAAPKYNIS